MEIQNLVPVDYSNQRVLTTAQVAEQLGCTTKQLRQNFNNNSDRFVEGRDYFKLTGDVLKAFRSYVDNIDLPLNKFAPALYLWTEWGVMLHAKILSTDEAWEKYKELVSFYFHHRDAVAEPVSAVVPPPFNMQTFQAVFRDIINAAVQDAVKVAVQDAVKVAVQDAVSNAINEAIKNVKAQPKDTCVYVLLLADKDNKKSVKIGITEDTINRFCQIRSSTNSFIVDRYTTQKISRDDAREIELTAQEYLRPYCTGGEFFDIDFQKACEVVAALFARQMNGEPLNEIFAKNMIDLIVNENLPRRKTKLEINLSISQSTRVYTPYPNLKAEMDAHLLTHSTLAKLLGKTRSNVSRKIRGERYFATEDKIRLVEIFNKPIEWLLWREDTNTAEQKNNAATNDDAE